MDFSQTFNCEGIFLSRSLDSLLFSEFRDVFSGPLARSVQDLRLSQRSRSLQWPARVLKGFIQILYFNGL